MSNDGKAARSTAMNNRGWPTLARALVLAHTGMRPSVKRLDPDVDTVRADCVIDAAGPWAGRLGELSAPLSLRPLRRHLFVSAPTDHVPAEAPIVWMEDAAFYFRPDSGGLLLSPCDETPAPPGTPPVDPAAAGLLAEKISRHAPGLADLAIRRSWACLRTFAPDRHPLIGADPLSIVPPRVS
jgi:D-arginine dehydrogenase